MVNDAVNFDASFVRAAHCAFEGLGIPPPEQNKIQPNPNTRNLMRGHPAPLPLRGSLRSKRRGCAAEENPQKRRKPGRL